MGLFDARKQPKSSRKGLFSQQLPSPPRRDYAPIQARIPQATDPERPSLISLGTDISTIIVDLVHDSHPKSVLDIALVSSYFHNLARYSQHRIITLKVPHDKDWQQIIRDRLDYIKKQGLLTAVREIQVIRPDFLDVHVLHHICRLIPKMTGLRDIRWAANVIPPVLLHTLQALVTNVRLHTQSYCGGFRKNNNINTLQASHVLRSLEVRSEYLNAEDCLAVTQPLKQILLTCPNLRSLTLDISLPTSGCVIYEPPSEYCGLGFTGSEKPLAALEEMVLTTYPFGTIPLTDSNGNVRPGMPYHVGYPGKVPELEYWAETFDWSRLRRLETGEIQFALELMPKLVASRNVALHSVRWHKEGTGRFYREIPSELEKIDVSKVECIGVDGIVRHGGKLRKLQIHQNEDYQGHWRQEAICAEHLRRIRDECPLIEELAIDVTRNDGEWPWETLDVLASFPRLTHLEVWFEIGLDNREEPVRPYVTFSAAAMLYTYVRQHATHQPSRLEELKVHSGSPPPMGHGYPSPAAYWPSSQSTTFTCTLSPRDDEAADGRFTTHCGGGLSVRDDEMEDVIEQIQKQTPGGKGEAEGRRKVALEGPTPINEWDERSDYW